MINYFQNHFHWWSCSNHFDEIFSKIPRGFRKGFGAQHSLLLMIGKRKKKQLIATKLFVQFLLTHQTLLSVFAMISLFQNYMLMVCYFLLWKWLKNTFLDPHTVHGRISYLVFLKDQSYDTCCSTCFYVIYVISAMQMTPLPMLLQKLQQRY